MVEHGTFNSVVMGSNPIEPTHFLLCCVLSNITPMDSCDIKTNLSPIGVIIMNRNFIFGSYVAVCLVGFATLFVVNAYATDPTPITATTAMMIVGFYSFFCTTCSFFLFDRFKAEADSRISGQDTHNEAIWREIDAAKTEATHKVDELIEEVNTIRWANSKVTTKK